MPGISISDIINNIEDGSNVQGYNISAVTDLLKEIFKLFNCNTYEDKEKYTRALTKILNSFSGKQTADYELAFDSVNVLNNKDIKNVIYNIIRNDVTMNVLTQLDGEVNNLSYSRYAFSAAGLYSLSNSQYGRNAISNAITVNPDGTIRVTFIGFNPSDKANGKNYVDFSLEELQNILNGKTKDGEEKGMWAKGDMDAILITAAYSELIYRSADNPTSVETKRVNGIWEALTGDLKTNVNYDYDKTPDDDWDKNKMTVTDWLNSLYKWQKSGSQYAAAAYLNSNDALKNGIQCKDANGNPAVYKSELNHPEIAIMSITDTEVRIKDGATGKEYIMSWVDFQKLDIEHTYSICFEREYPTETQVNPNIPRLEGVKYTNGVLTPETILGYCNSTRFDNKSIKQLADMFNTLFEKYNLDDSQKIKFISTVLDSLAQAVNGSTTKEHGLKQTTLESLNKSKRGFFNWLQEKLESPKTFCDAFLRMDYGSVGSYDYYEDINGIKQGHAGSWIASGIVSALNTDYGKKLIDTTQNQPIVWNDNGSVTVKLPGFPANGITIEAQELADLWQDGASSYGSPTVFILSAAYSKYVIMSGMRTDGASLHSGYAQDFWSVFFEDTIDGIQDNTEGCPITVDDKVEESDIENWLQKLLNYENFIPSGTKSTKKIDYAATFGVKIVPDSNPLVIHTIDGNTLHYSSNMTRGLTVKSVTNGTVTIWDPWNGDYTMTWKDFKDTFGDKIYSLRDIAIYNSRTEGVINPDNGYIPGMEDFEEDDDTTSTTPTNNNAKSFIPEEFNLGENYSFGIDDILKWCNDQTGKTDAQARHDTYGKLTSLFNKAFDTYGLTTDNDKKEFIKNVLTLLWQQYGDGSEFNGTITSKMIDVLNQEITNVLNDKGDTIVQKYFFDKLSDFVYGNYFYTVNWLQNIYNDILSGKKYESIAVTVYARNDVKINCANGKTYSPNGKTTLIIEEIKDGKVKFKDGNNVYETTIGEFARLNIFAYSSKVK